MRIGVHFVVFQIPMLWNCPWVSESSLLKVKAIVLSENGEREKAYDPMKSPLTMVGLWNQVSEQDNVLFTILTGQFGWHILGISADSMTATCTPSTNPHLQLQMVHNFFPVFITALGGGGKWRFHSQAALVRWVFSPVELQYIPKTNLQNYIYSMLANRVSRIRLHKHYLAESHLWYTAYH